MTDLICAVDGCTKKAKPGYREPMCGMHRERIRNHGSTDNPRQRQARLLFKGYWMVYLPSHPLRNHKGYIGEHRVVLYAKVGGGTQRCHWCNKSIKWAEERKWDAIMVDHVDRNPLNNDPDNLVPSCMDCNLRRHDGDKQECSNGHPYTDENVYKNQGRRRCRMCANARQRRYQARKRAAEM